ncbi:MAG TPA: M20/M25/M40 family metallo-hydrolase [Gemmatimonadaceae bacterium]|nr:M20/M25/M40 family metallo-hydrolase [Gemmatimonadaceae bacterium]
MLRRTAIIASVLSATAAAQSGPVAAAYATTAARIQTAALADSGVAWTKLARFTDYSGNRFTGSPALERGIDWVLAEMKKDGLDNVRGEPAMVPHWVRGAESATLVEPRVARLPMLGLGGSIGTPKGGITAEVMVVSTFDELTNRAAEAKGKIVLFDAPFVSYGQTVAYRREGAIAASKAGAVASLIRSVTPYSMRTPHTGQMAYDSTVRKIPHAAITVEDAMMIHRMINRGEKVVVRLEMDAQTLPDVPSRNAIGEIRGSEKPDEVIVLGGHIDSWDVGQGAMDDGGGLVVAWEALNLLKKLGLKPKRTIRVVGWTNEETMGRGGLAYAAAHKAEADKHVLVVESDGGVFAPESLGFTGSDSARAIMKQIGALLSRVGPIAIGANGGGADIEPMMELGVPGVGLEVDGSKYFWFHHTDADTVDKLDPVEMQRCVAAMAVLAYIVADLPEKLPRTPR